MCIVIDKALFTLKRADNFDSQYMLPMAMEGVVAWQLLANKIVVIYSLFCYNYDY